MGGKKKKGVHLLVDDEASSDDDSESNIMAREAAAAKEEGYEDEEEELKGYEDYLPEEGAEGKEINAEDYDRPTAVSDEEDATTGSLVESLENNKNFMKMLQSCQLYSDMCTDDVLRSMKKGSTSDDEEDEEFDAKPKKQQQEDAEVLAPWERESKRQRTEAVQDKDYWKKQISGAGGEKGGEGKKLEGPAFDSDGNPLPGTIRSTKLCRLLGKKDKSLRLFPHQVEGARWLMSLVANGFNGILADEMGLGKTVQIIAFLACLIQEDFVGPHLIVAPLSTLSNWEQEFRRWLPALPVCVYHGKAKERQSLRSDILKRMKDIHDEQDDHHQSATAVAAEDQKRDKKKKSTESRKRREKEKEEAEKAAAGLRTLSQGKGCVVITSYEMVLCDDCPFADETKYKWGMLIVDEAHRLKNFDCVLIKHLKRLSVDNRYLLTGTPLQNNLAELWSILNFICSEVFSSLDEFKKWFSIDALDHRNEEEADTSYRGGGRGRAKEHEKSSRSSATPTRSPKSSRSSTPTASSRNSSKSPPSRSSSTSSVQGANRTSKPAATALVAGIPRSEGVEATSGTSNATTGFTSPQQQQQHLVSQTSGWQPSSQLVRNPTAMRRLNESDATVQLVAKMHRILRPFVLRRTKDEIPNLKLPKKVEVVIHCPLHAEQKKAYNYVQRHENYSKARLIHLRKACCHPFLFDELDPFHDAIQQQELSRMEKDMYWPALVAASSKLTMLHHMLPKLYRAGHKVLLFSQLTSVLDILEDYLTHEPTQYPYQRLDGTHSLSDRKASLAKFAAGTTPVSAGSPIFPTSAAGNNNDQERDGGSFLFLISTRAGGQGINLTAADTVILFDSDFNPHNDLQAIDRCHRIGQRADPVVVYRLLCPNTVEETVFSISLRKIKLEKLLIESGKFNRRARTSRLSTTADDTTVSSPNNTDGRSVPSVTTTAGGASSPKTQQQGSQPAASSAQGGEDQEAIELLREDYRAILDLKFGDFEIGRKEEDGGAKKKGKGRERIEKPAILLSRRKSSKTSKTLPPGVKNHRSERELQMLYADVDTNILPPLLGEEQLSRLCLDRKWLAAGGAGTVEEQQEMQHQREKEEGKA